DRSLALRRAATLAGRQAHRMGVGRLAWYSGDLDAAGAESVVVGLGAGSWEYRELKTPPKEEERRTPLTEAVILTSGDAGPAEAGLAAGQALDAGYALARRLGMMPGNLCTPDYLAQTAREIGERHGLRVTVLGRDEMEGLKMGSFLSVAQGTSQDPKLISLEYQGGAKGDKPVALVGKGLCFDTGGISIKPAQGMEHMKFDMCGAAGVLGAMEAIARLRLRVNVVGLVGSTTNMPSGDAVKPGDVVQAASGKYIEVINTDAEGRLVLADVLTYAKQFEPVAVVDAATLTGACVIALGHVATGVFGTDEGLIQEVLAAGKRAAEPGWALPLWDEYKEQIKSDVADIKNTGGRPAGSITAALFLKEFAEGYPWVHLDIAGTAYSESDLVVLPKGPTGVPVGTFVGFVRGRAG
ncbi:MAG TPA: leucyl aminopeptidase, partial [Gemmatimonadaceae bacterium]|nr:leucyl aminopeptidase [Gemmatimonadaceae bacterium]